MTKLTLIAALVFSQLAFSHTPDLSSGPIKAVYADLNLLKQASIPVLYADETLQIGYAIVSGPMQQKISELAHLKGRCGNFGALDEIPNDINSVKLTFDNLLSIHNKNISYQSLAPINIAPPRTDAISSALLELKSANIRTTVEWLSSYPTRFNRATQPNIHVDDFYKKLQEMTAASSYPVQIDLISHRNTQQKSIRLSIRGQTKPDELVIMGGHLDSINGSWGGSGRAPGADDNASGSAALLEALRVLLQQPQPQRTVEFFWYAGEESGLLGSAEIAETYKTQKKNVIAVLQLDMTMFPGDGENKITSMTDFTSPWLRDYLKAINATYLNIQIQDDKCGYGCSDHASWFKRGFPAVFPTESKFNSSFQYIHTDRDVISSVMSFEHALIFSKIALIMTMDLGNSNQRETLF